jgi:hypothetical protein
VREFVNPVKRATEPAAKVSAARLRGLGDHLISSPKVPLRFTLGFMLSPA